LNDGRIFDGDIIGSNEYSYFMLADGLRYEFPRSKVAWLSSTHANIHATLFNLAESSEAACVPVKVPQKQAAAQPPASEPAAQEKTEPASVPVSAYAEEPVVFVAPLPDIHLPLPENPRITNYLRSAVQDLSDQADPGLRPPAIEALREAGAHGLAILVEDGLYNIDPSVRAQSVELLGTLGQKNVLRHLIEAFQTAASAHIPSDQTNYIYELTDWISTLTDDDFYIRERGGAPAVAENMTAWWNRNWMNMPRQLGEPQLDPEAPDYMAQLKELRRLHSSQKDAR